MKALQFLILTLFSWSAAAQSTQTIGGLVIDSESEFPLIGATVELIEGSGIGTTTDDDGRFRLSQVPLGRVTLSVSYLGYEVKTIPNLLVTSGKEPYVEVLLVEQVAALAQVVVTDQSTRHGTVNDLATVSARTFSMDEAVRYSGTFGDPSRMVQSYAGVSGASDDRNDIIIRGNSPTGVLWRMEGVDILSPNHFSNLGTTGGPVSMLNVNNLQNSDFLTSAFPSEYGNATAGVFDLKLRKGNSEKFEFLGQIGFNGFEAGIEGPLGISEGSSFMINGRYSTLGVFGALGIDFGTGSAIPEYQDVTFKVNVPTAKAGRFALWGFGGTSDIQFLAEESGSNNLYSDDDENTTFGSNTGTIGFTHTYFINSNSLTQVSLTYGLSSIIGTVDEYRLDREIFEREYEQDFKQAKIGLNIKYNNKLNTRQRITIGLSAEKNGVKAIDSVRTSSGDFRNNIDFDGNADLYQAHINYQHRFSDRTTLNLGLHGQLLELNRSFAIEPRVGFEFKATSRHALTLGIGMHSQTQPIPIYAQVRRDAAGAETASNKNLDFSKSVHFATGWNWQFADQWRLKSEIYYQHLYSIAVDSEPSSFSLINTGADFGFPDRAGLVNEGLGRNYGLEFTLEKFFSQGFYLLSTASLFDSKYKGSDGVLRNTLYNSNYVLNLLGGKEIGISEKWTLTFDSKVTYSGGRRDTPFDLERSFQENRVIRLRDRAYENRLPAYFRVDLKLGFRLNGKKSSQHFYVDLTNMTGRRNVFQRALDLDKERIRYTYQRGFFPDVRYQISF